MHAQLIELITQHVPLSAQHQELCRRFMEPVFYPKNSIIEEEGKVPAYLYYVVSGFLRLFHYNDRGDEVTTHINCPPGFITSYTHFNNGSCSEENLECITECELLRITKVDLDLLIKQIPSFKDFSIYVFQQSLSYNEKRSKGLATFTAEQRYLRLMDVQPELLQNVPMQYIASFLGMNPKSLSRIRKQIIR
ncbi:DNA-binding protein [Sphingobacterium faecium NBRC 15299]|uniref:Crp/Fnr family transcriptional regulator n=1 Tax=Sphingobacterium faecium TaxID=34087 RepID=UPI000D3727AC|nr:Crp/Fnr family transcriptional regulator [Sphingobacterium faecium]PTX14051.1 CRP-like cAMP-binding protein [Sphingobacterium faecium]GEM64130.1 DNA-binding protein [Sphingobacterium faecium NBRC 15299]